MERYKGLLNETSALYQDYDQQQVPESEQIKQMDQHSSSNLNEFQFTGLVFEDSDDDALLVMMKTKVTRKNTTTLAQYWIMTNLENLVMV